MQAYRLYNINPWQALDSGIFPTPKRAHSAAACMTHRTGLLIKSVRWLTARYSFTPEESSEVIEMKCPTKRHDDREMCLWIGPRKQGTNSTLGNQLKASHGQHCLSRSLLELLTTSVSASHSVILI